MWYLKYRGEWGKRAGGGGGKGRGGEWGSRGWRSVRGSGPKDIRGGVMGKRSAEETNVLESEGEREGEREREREGGRGRER